METKKAFGKAVVVVMAVFLFSGLAEATIIDVCDGKFNIENGDSYNTVNVYNDAAINMTGGYAFYCNMFNTSTWDYYDGDMGVIDMNDNSMARLYADQTPTMYLYNESQIHIYNGSLGPSAFIYDDSELHIYGQSLHWAGWWVEGYWLDGRDFRIHVRNSNEIVPEDHLFLHEIPEPATFAFWGIGTLLMRSNTIFKEEKNV